MSESQRTRITFYVMLVTAALSLGGWIVAFAGSRAVDAATLKRHETEIMVLQAEREKDSHRLSRIETNVEWLVKALGGNPRNLKQ